MDEGPSAPRRPISGKKRSGSAEAARQAEFERLRQMTPVQRMKLALELGRRMRRIAHPRVGSGTSSGE